MTVAFGVFFLFLPLAITAFGGPEGCFKRSEHFDRLSPLSPNTIVTRRNGGDKKSLDSFM